MTNEALYKLKYPIGEFKKPEVITATHITQWIAAIEALPKAIEKSTKNLNDTELNYQYRPKSWTIRQVVHHCADSHINSILRFKLALTEDTPTIKPYLESEFAKLIDYAQPIDASTAILKGVHHKLGILLKHLSTEDLQKAFVHPEHGKRFSLAENIGIYAWHSNHHLAHIKQALKYKGVFN